MSLEDLVADAPFSYRSMKNGLVEIAYNGRAVVNLRGREAARFLNRVESGDEKNAQLVMAKATGHFKHGNERASKR